MAFPSILDWIALGVFVACWVVYALVVDRVPAIRARSVIAAMDEHRRRWMIAALPRENRIADIAAIGNLMSSVSFLATTSILILGGLVAMLAAPDIGRRVVAALPWGAVPDDMMWEVKIGLLLLIFVNAFFELTWALRQFNYTCTLVMAMPQDAQALRHAEAAARLANRAARHFNTGLRSYYFGLAALAWIVHPIALMVASLLVLRELHRREFRSAARDALTPH
ncbi:DUF599 domain-containing protein [Roseomonas alkaliterrae]|uniref:Putative membrane protein n=1 Tax=Neoroseomonas alkaliterrae TaxID=1452450 RepID=A0A840XKV8_9PROT|nr:DUF599 domain-containing protein [Neoroseomonas alkaliterrae]MBB5689168.1 putative membrane protein [Neoroseomonas alkaliterrae]MBR0675361.1 DUF599 domain-containing protein [Neoroseomonas alkaliterrae]